jgi:hypothetical protein
MRTLLLILTSVLVACAQPKLMPADVAGARFYPALPDVPRIQHLTSISGEADLKAPPSGFEKMVLGDDPQGAQQLKQPYGVAMFEGKLYVADSRAPGVAVFDFAGQSHQLITGGPGWRLRRPINVRIDVDGTKYVTDTGLNQIVVLDRENKYLRSMGDAGQFKPVDAVISGERLYVADIEHHQIQVLNKKSGQLLFKFGKPGSELGELFHPTNLAVASNGDVLVVETSNFRVQRFSAEGKALRTFGGIGTRPGSFARPKGIALDAEGRMYVTDAAFENVQLFDEQGRLLLNFGDPDGKGGGLHLPTGVTVDYKNIEHFRKFIDPNFQAQYLIFTSSQFGPNRIDVFAFGSMKSAATASVAPRPHA